MSDLHLGLGPWGGDPRGPTESFARLLEQSLLAEQLGFQSVWIPEGHFQPGSLFSAPLVVLAAVAARTRRIRLGTTSFLLPVRHPIRIAEDVAVLDHLSGGRVILGVGRGFRRSLFEAFELAPSEKRDRFDEVLERVLSAWRGEPLPHVRDRELRVTPRPLQRPHPPIWVAAFGPKALAQASRLGLPYLASPVEPLERLVENYARHREGLPAGVEPATLAVPAIRTVFVTQRPEVEKRVRDGLAAQAEAIARQLGDTLPHAGAAPLEEWALVGEPDAVADQIERYRETIGLTHLIARVQVPGAEDAEVEAASAALPELGARWA